MIGEPSRVRVELGARSYDVLVGGGLIARAGALIRPFVRRAPAIVVTDSNVARHHLAPFRASLEAAGVEAVVIEIAPGEQAKQFAGLQHLLEAVLDTRPERRSTLIALGGGVIGDLAGFAAAILLRGIDFIQVPTTLLAQVDSSVGGKTAIDTRHGKNLVGAFYQPRLVLADIDALATLPAREVRAGYAEVVKYGLIDDPAFFEWLDADGMRRVLAGDAEARRHAVTTCVAAMGRIVGADEREEAGRALLNLGHTFGHALETETGFGDSLLHGEGVALGIVLAFELSARLGLCPAADAERVRRHMAAAGLPWALAGTPLAGAAAGVLLDHMRQDKKVRDGRLTFILARGIGQAFLTRDVAAADVEALLRTALAA